MPRATISPNFKALLMESLCHDLLHNVNRVAYQQGAIDYCRSIGAVDLRQRVPATATHTIICDSACVSGKHPVAGRLRSEEVSPAYAAEFG